MLSIRQRGTYWHARGVVREGTKKERIREHSTGETEEAAARAYADSLERDTQARLRLGAAAPKRQQRLPFSEAVVRYVDAVKPKSGDVWRLGVLLEHFGDTPLPDIDAESWDRFCRECLPGRKPNSKARYQTTLRGVFTEVGAGVKFPDNIAFGGERAERVRWLQIEQADALIEAYAFHDPDNARKSAKSPHGRAIGLTLRFLGVRSSECLQIKRNLFDDKRGPCGSIFIEKSKNGLSRWVPLHPRVREAWEPLLGASRPIFLRDGKAINPLFLTDKGIPYRDPRIKGDGGNPFSRAHTSACKRIGLEDFTPHDWRHHWATWAVRNGMDLRTLQELGGWLDLNQVQRYAAVDPDDAAEKIARAK